MDRLRAFSSGLRNMLPGSSSSTPGTKLSKAYRFDKEHNVLSRPQDAHDPFKDGPIFEEPSLDKTHLILHIVSGFFSFLAICTTGAVAGFQAKWLSVSGGTGFVLFLTLLSFLLTLVLMIVPIVYDRWDKLRRPAQFLAVTRSTLILHAFGTTLMLLASFIVTISAWTAKGCKNVDDDPHADLGDDFKNGLKQWCTTKKASAIFEWFSFGAWAALLVFSVIAFRRERRREPGFLPPSSDGISYANVRDHIPSSRQAQAAEDPYADKHELSAAGPAGAVTGYESYGYSRAPVSDDDNAFGRPSMDAYGAFEEDSRARRGVSPGAGGGGEETSRTMQLAYSDPYEQIRQNLMSPAHEGYGGGSGYAVQSLPQPPAYRGGY